MGQHYGVLRGLQGLAAPAGQLYERL